LKESKEEYKILVMAILLAGACYLTYYFHVVLETGTIFTHYFYIPIILAALWWRRKGLIVAIFLAGLILFSNIFVRVDVPAANDYFRVLMFIAIAFVVVTLSERIAKAREELESKVDDRTKELREEKRFTENVIATVPDSLLVLDKDLRIKSANRSFYEKFQTEPDEVLGSSIAEVLGDKDGKLSDALTKLFGTGTGAGDMLENFVLHYQSEKLGERIFNVTARGMLVEEEEEEEEEELVVLEDITERKKAEEALRKSEEKYRDLAELLPEVIFETDLEGNITYANQIAFDSFGYTQSDFDKGINALQMLIPEDRDRGKESIQRVLSGETIGSREYTAQRKDKTTFPVIINSRQIIHENKPVGLRGVIIDITERKRAEVALRESEEKYRTLYDSSRDAIMTLTPEDGFLSGNPAAVEIFGCKDEKEFTSRTPHDLSPQYQPDGTLSSEKDKQMMAIAMEKGSHFFEWTHKRMDGHEFTATVLLTRMELQGRRMLQATVRDITERKRAEEMLRGSHEKLKELDKMKTDFLAVAYHEMRTPLAPIIGYTSLLERGELNEKQKKYVRIIEESAYQLEELIGSLLEVTRIEAGKAELTLESVSIPEIVDNVLERVKPQADEKKQTISTAVPEEIEIEGDKQKIAAIFDNLILNAIKYTGENGKIDVVVEDRKKEEDISVCVSDTGVGISEEHLPMVFERFYMVDTSLTRKGGLGVGLAIVKGYVELHGGVVWATSERGKGSKFCFTLPKKQR